MIKWTVKDAIRCLNELKDPFEGTQPTGQLSLAERIKQKVDELKEVKPQ